jgi:hypothetical protein
MFSWWNLTWRKHEKTQTWTWQHVTCKGNIRKHTEPLRVWEPSASRHDTHHGYKCSSWRKQKWLLY